MLSRRNKRSLRRYTNLFSTSSADEEAHVSSAAIDNHVHILSVGTKVAALRLVPGLQNWCGRHRRVHRLNSPCRCSRTSRLEYLRRSCRRYRPQRQCLRTPRPSQASQQGTSAAAQLASAVPLVATQGCGQRWTAGKGPSPP